MGKKVIVIDDSRTIREQVGAVSDDGGAAAAHRARSEERRERVAREAVQGRSARRDDNEAHRVFSQGERMTAPNRHLPFEV
jgi:hypothetical protein